MKIGGFGELENMRRAITREDAKNSKSVDDKADTKPAGANKTDEVELSSTGKALGKLRQVPEVRTERVEAIKNQVERGDYVTRERLHNGIKKLLREL